MYKTVFYSRVIQARLPDRSISVITIQYHAEGISSILSVFTGGGGILIESLFLLIPLGWIMALKSY